MKNPHDDEESEYPALPGRTRTLTIKIIVCWTKPVLPRPHNMPKKLPKNGITEQDPA